MFKSCQRAKILHVIGEAKGEVLVKMQTCLKHPDLAVQNPILDERFEVQDLQKHLLPGKVVLQGKLVKNIIFKAAKASSMPVEHQQVVEPFEVEISLPGLRPGIRVDNRLIFPANPLEEIDLQVHLLSIHSDTSLRKGKCENQSNDDESSQDMWVFFMILR